MGKLLALALTLLLAACGGGGGLGTAGTGAAPSAPQFRPRTPGVLTVATELPNPPFVLGDDLNHLKGGLEVDMVDAIARRLGVQRVQWVSFPFTRLVAGDPCPCDFDVNGVSILPDRRQRVDFSSPYFTANQGVLVRKGTVVSGVADARRLRFGVQEATSGAAYLDKVLKPPGRPGPTVRPRPRSAPCGPARSTRSCRTSRSWPTPPPGTLAWPSSASSRSTSSTGSSSPRAPPTPGPCRR